MSNASLLYLAMEWSGTIGVALLTFMTACLFYTRYRKGLRDIPGPFLASILPLDRILSTARGDQFATHLGYHRKYGQLVRVGPNHVSFSDAEAIPLVYSINTKYFKVSSTHLPARYEHNSNQLRAISTASSTPNRLRATSPRYFPFATKPRTAPSKGQSLTPIPCQQW
jgi:hypothetical protein